MAFSGLVGTVGSDVSHPFAGPICSLVFDEFQELLAYESSGPLDIHRRESVHVSNRQQCEWVDV